jgi:uncharacterized YigZ family protein
MSDSTRDGREARPDSGDPGEPGESGESASGENAGAELPPVRPPYRTIAGPVRYEIERVKGSRFLGEARPIANEQAAAAAIASIREAMPDATHHCFAWRLREGGLFKSSDDGEPGGSAGRPILAQIAGHELDDVLVVVTRYFGGVKLGVGGLVRAYGLAAAKVLEAAEGITVTPKRPLWIAYDYGDTTPVESALRALELAPVRTEYAEGVRALLEVPDADWERVRATLRDHTSGRVRFAGAD